MSQSSPETGDARPDEPAAAGKASEDKGDGKRGKARGRDRDAKRTDDAAEPDSREARDSRDTPDTREAREHRGPGPLAIELEVSRNRYAGWTVFGLVFGALLVWKLGTVGVWVGVVLMLLGALRAWQLIQTFLHPPGTIVVGDNEVTLPRGLCLSRPIKVAPKEVTAVYFLRRSVPWNRSAPVLVVELGPKAMAFPRDWFASEADQRHVVHALMRTRGVTPPASVTDTAAEPAH